MSVVMFNAATPDQPAGLVDRLIAETLTLAEDAKAHLINRPIGKSKASPLPVLAEVAEISRVTARVTHCMAWLMARKAVSSGEMSEDEGRQDAWRLGDKEICETQASHDIPLSPMVQRLSDRSLALYERIARLDQGLVP